MQKSKCISERKNRIVRNKTLSRVENSAHTRTRLFSHSHKKFKYAHRHKIYHDNFQKMFRMRQRIYNILSHPKILFPKVLCQRDPSQKKEMQTLRKRISTRTFTSKILFSTMLSFGIENSKREGM